MTTTSTVGREVERKFLLARSPNLASPFMAFAEIIQIEQFFIPGPGPQRVRYRKAVSNKTGETTYTRTAKVTITAAVKDEEEIEVTKAEYDQLMLIHDQRRGIVRKVRRVFTWRGRIFELDKFENPEGMWILEVELDDEAEVHTYLELPPGIEIDREVTFDEGWSQTNPVPRRPGRRG